MRVSLRPVPVFIVICCLIFCYWGLASLKWTKTSHTDRMLIIEHAKKAVRPPLDAHIIVLIWPQKCFKPFFPVENINLMGGIELTYDRAKLPIADYVVFHTMCLDDVFPSLRYSWQSWLLFSLEPPTNYKPTRATFDKFDGVFNFTAGYSSLADLHIQYGGCGSRHVSDSNSYGSISEQFQLPTKVNKTGGVAWVVSNCNASSQRMKLVDQLKKHIPVDKYGECAKGRIPRVQFDSVLKPFKFYLSFENSFCRDYITEKFYNIVSMPDTYIIPVVLGAGDYDRILPKSAYIDVRDFSSTVELGKHLMYINQNNTAFMEYFSWKTHTECQYSFDFFYMQISRAIKKIHGKHNILSSTNLSKVFGQETCFSANDYFFSKFNIV